MSPLSLKHATKVDGINNTIQDLWIQIDNKKLSKSFDLLKKNKHKELQYKF
jgi:hypothetical protein